MSFGVNVAVNFCSPVSFITVSGSFQVHFPLSAVGRVTVESLSPSFPVKSVGSSYLGVPFIILQL